MQSDLFDVADLSAPLAERMRPVNLDELLGQNRILGEKSMLRRVIEQDQVPSMILWGPPGCGKTSLAHIIERRTSRYFVKLSAVSAGVKDVKDTILLARERRRLRQGTIVFIDEIHRFNKAQQDALLGAVEDGTITLLGATTENPSFEINNALLSRCQLILFSPLDQEHLTALFWAALRDHPRGLRRGDLRVDDDVVAKLVSQADGDARFLLNQIEWIVSALGKETHLSADLLNEIQYKKPLRYDRHYDEHYNLISALHKSVRGSDVHAALYWLHRMLQAGEDPRYLLRRMTRMAMEDIGLADPQAVQLAAACLSAYELLGPPEGLLALDQLAVYLSLAPKSNALEKAAAQADALIQRTGTLPVPKAFRPDSSAVGRQLGYGKGYIYDHDALHAYAGQDHLPVALRGSVLYEPTSYGYEEVLRQRMEQLTQWRVDYERTRDGSGKAGEGS